MVVSPLKILLTNDDGIDAPGLQSLYAAVRSCFGQAVDVTVVAPDRGRSECGHSVTSGRPLGFQHVRQGWIAVDGTPVDCVRAALTSLAPDAAMVISGVNSGANLGVDLLVSGTFAAAREAALHGVAAMAVSHYRRPELPVTWDHVPGWLEPTMQEFTRALANWNGAVHGLLWNVNLPAIDPTAPRPPQVHCAVDRLPLLRTAHSVGTQLHLQSDFHGRPREQGSDVHHCFAGQITISELTPHLGLNRLDP